MSRTVEMILYTPVALLLFVGSLIWKYNIANYEFRNRGSGGLISFQSLPHAWLHRLLKFISWLTLLAGLTMTLVVCLYWYGRFTS